MAGSCLTSSADSGCATSRSTVKSLALVHTALLSRTAMSLEISDWPTASDHRHQQQRAIDG